MKKKILVMVFALSVCVFAGCGKSDTVSTTAPVAQEEGTAEQGAEEQEEAETSTEEEKERTIQGALFQSDMVTALYSDQTTQLVYELESDSVYYIYDAKAYENNIYVLSGKYNSEMGGSVYSVIKIDANGQTEEVIKDQQGSGDKLFFDGDKLLARVTLNYDQDYRRIEIQYDLSSFEEVSQRDLTEEEIDDGNMFIKYGDFMEEHKLSPISEADGIAYFATQSSDFGGIEERTIFAYDPESGDLKELYSAKEYPGIPRGSMKGEAGFCVIDGYAYFLDTDGRTLNWYSYDVSQEKGEKQKLAGYEKTYQLFDYGTVEYDERKTTCDDCDLLLSQYYVEKFIFSDAVPHAQDMNQVLEERFEFDKSEAIRTVDSFTDEDREYMHQSDYPMTYSSTMMVTNVSKFGHYLTIDYDGYDYMGGAHGYPTRAHFLFDLDSGKQVTMGDLFTGSEEEFKTIVADATLKDYQSEKHDYYFEMDSPDAFHDSVYEYANFTMLMSYTENGIVIEYPPYEFGPYASGYIEVSIPYSALLVNMD